MATRGEHTTAANLMNRENMMLVKTKDHNLVKVPIRRPALGDVSNKISYHGTKTIDAKKMTNLQKPSAKPVVSKEISKKEKITCETRNVFAQPEVKPLPPRPIKREESILDSLSAFSSKQLRIYDPDENTKNDPNAVTEYLEDIFSHLREMEQKHAVQQDYLKDHKTTPSMRAVLINWIIELQINFKLCIETLHLSISIIDRYLQVNKDIGRDTLQLVGATAVMIASKYEEVCIPEISDFVYVCDDTFSSRQILAMERDILAVLKFCMGRPSSIHFLRRYSKIAKVTPLQHNLGKYLIELALLDYTICHIPPSHQAAAACCLSIGILNDEMDLSKVWSPTLVHYTTYKLTDFRYVVVLLARLIVKVEGSKHQAITQKYSAAAFGKISTNAKLKGRLVMKLAAEVPAKKR